MPRPYELSATHFGVWVEAVPQPSGKCLTSLGGERQCVLQDFFGGALHSRDLISQDDA
jgi:hypothetical protein